MLECVVNISEGRNHSLIDHLAQAAGPGLLDVHRDPDHHRSVLTIAGHPDVVEAGARALARVAVARLDLTDHAGAHPRMGVLDVVPWVALEGWPLADGPIKWAIEGRDELTRWAGRTLELPCFTYGPERSLPDVRRQAWVTLDPDTGPCRPHPTAGAAAIGARGMLVAYNLWLADADLAAARAVAHEVRSPHVRTLALEVGSAIQVSCNLIHPRVVGPEAVFDAVAGRVGVARAELVGLVPGAVLEAIPHHRWAELDLDPSATIEARLEQAGLDGGSLQS